MSSPGRCNCRRTHDDTTHFLSNWSKSSITHAKSKGIQVLDLYQKRARKDEVESMLSKQSPTLVVLNGHGSEDRVCGHENEPLLTVRKNETLLKGKIVYALSCRSAKKLGPRSVKAGARSYIGYNDDFVFFYDTNNISRPKGELTIAMSANKAVHKDLLHYLDAIPKAA